MELNIVKNEKNELRLEISIPDQGFLNMVKDELWKDSSVELAGFHIEHPDSAKPLFILKTKGKAAKQVWNTAIDSLTKRFDSLKKELKVIK